MIDTSGGRFIILAVCLLLALTVAAIAAALGESEARSDQRTLLAVGADPALRRWIVGSRAAVLALLAGLLAVPAGLLPVWGLSHNWGYGLTVPILDIVGMLLVLPLAAGALLLTRPIPDWLAFRDVGPG